VPYLPVDPAGLGCTYEEVIRVDSPSGKGGIAPLLQVHHGVGAPRAGPPSDLRADFSRTVRRATDGSGQEVTPKDLGELFRGICPAPGRTVRRRSPR